MNRILFFRLASVAVVAGIWVLSLAPSNGGMGVAGSDKLHHALAYFVCMFCLSQWIVLPVARLKLALALIAMGVLIEILQRFTATRSYEVLDMLANAIGVSAAWVTVSVQRSWQRRTMRGR